MEFMYFCDISFGPGFDIGLQYTKLNNIVGAAIWFDTYKMYNTKCLTCENISLR
jgi:hypothetical protein